MQAIEFKAKAKDGMIKIPKKYLGMIHGTVRIIILIRNTDAQKSKPARKEL